MVIFKVRYKDVRLWVRLLYRKFKIAILFKDSNDKMQEKVDNIIQQINENIQKMKDDLKVETITDLAKILIKSNDQQLIKVGNFLIKEVDSIRKGKNLLTGGGKYKSKKHNRTKKSKKYNRTKKHKKSKKSKKHNRTKKKR